ncbi:MAG TPA: hypothetical protein VJ963_01195 [Bacteroidales bacterium]|nr:hypothetical protein [Bacteroidales bacterium]
MNKLNRNVFDDNRIVSGRGSKNNVTPGKPYAWLAEKERTASGETEETSIIFLTNRECSFHCLMCDLWKNTTDSASPPGSLAVQIEFALKRLPPAKHLKLYNSGSFFDERAIAEAEYKEIASLISHFDTVLVESHPRLINEKVLRFRDLLKPSLQVAMGLETVNNRILSMLNKNMTVEDFRRAAVFLRKNNILSRAFILLRPPYLSEEEGIMWAERSIDFAFSSGSECCTVIPVRAGNGVMDYLQSQGFFHPPRISSLEKVTGYGISLGKGRVFADLWDLDKFSTCDICFRQRLERLDFMNINQIIPNEINCSCDTIL